MSLTTTATDSKLTDSETIDRDANIDNVRSVVFQFKGWTGWDAFRFEGKGNFPFSSIIWSILWIFLWPTPNAQVLRVAQGLLNGPYKDFNFDDPTGRLVISMPFGAFQIIDDAPTVRRCRVGFAITPGA